MLYDIQQRRDALVARMKDPTTMAGMLENGMEWFVRRNFRPENKVLVCLIIKTGSAYEEPGHFGLAHFIEHMLFNGTKSYEGEALIEELQHLGVGFGHDLNAYTSLDHTVYHLEIERSPENVTKALHILSEFAFDARLEAKHIEKERPIILEEKRLRSGRGEKYIRMLLEKLFATSGYARLVIGTDEDITGVQKHDFEQFYGQWYLPDNMAIAVVGDVDTIRTQTEIKRLFERTKGATTLPASPLGAITDFSQPESYSLFTHEETATGGLHFFTTRKSLRGKVAEEDHLSWMRYVIAETLSERCQTYITDHATAISQTQCEYVDEYTRCHDMFTLGCVFDPQQITEAVTFLATEMERMRRYGPTQEEVDRICMNLRSRLEQSITEKDNTQHWPHVQKIMSSFLHEDEIGTPEEDLQLLEVYQRQTDHEQLLEVARDLLNKQHLVCMLEMPPKQAEDTLLQSVQDIMQNAAQAEILPQGETEAHQEEERFMTEHAVLNIQELGGPLEMTKLTLSSGTPCYIKQTNFQKDVFSIRILFEAGDIYLPRHQQGLTEMLLKYMSDSGTKRRSASTIHKLLQDRTLSIRLEEEPPSSIALFASCKTADAPLLMELIHDILFEPAWKEVGWLHAKQHMDLLIEEARANPRAVFSEAHTRVLLHDHPSAFMPQVEDVALWTPELLQDYYTRTFVSSNMHVVIVSSMSTDILSSLATRYLSTLPEGTKPSYEDQKVSVAWLKEPVQQTMYGANEEKASVHYSLPGVPYLDPLNSLFTVIGEILSDRLRKAVRESMGNTYSISASHHGYMCLKGGDFSIRFGTGPGEAARTLERIKEEIERMKEEGVTKDELARVLAPRRTQFQAHLKENNFWLQCLMDPWNNIPETYLFDRYKRMQETTAEELSSFLQSSFHTGPAVTSILLPKKPS